MAADSIVVDGHVYTKGAPVPPSTSDRDYYVKLGNSNAHAKAALTAAARRVGSVHTADAGYCLRVVRTLEACPAGAPTAAAAWHAVPMHLQHSWYDAPAGVPVFWTGGSTGAGHIAISDGAGNVYTTDMDAKGNYVKGAYSKVPTSWIAKYWKLTYAGWGETLNGVEVYTEPATPASTPAPAAPAPAAAATPVAPVAVAPAAPASTPAGCGAAGCHWRTTTPGSES